MNLHKKILDIPETPPSYISRGLFSPAWNGYQVGHLDACHAAAELALKADYVLAAARAVLEFRIDTPTRGDLRDNDASRAALKALADAVRLLGEA